MAGFGIDTEMEPSDGLNVGSEGREGKIQGFSLEPVMMTLLSMVTLPFTVELTFLLLFWETFSLRLSGQVISDVTRRSQ